MASFDMPHPCRGKVLPWSAVCVAPTVKGVSGDGNQADKAHIQKNRLFPKGSGFGWVKAFEQAVNDQRPEKADHQGEGVVAGEISGKCGHSHEVQGKPGQCCDHSQDQHHGAAKERDHRQQH